MPKIEIYVDGSFSPTKQMYGCGAVILVDGKIVRELSIPGTEKDFNKYHNVAGEVFAALTAFMYVQQFHPEADDVTCYYDYAGLELWATGKWNANSSLAIGYKESLAALPFTPKFVHVKAHTGVTYNERADMLARKAVGLD